MDKWSTMYFWKYIFQSVIFKAYFPQCSRQIGTRAFFGDKLGPCRLGRGKLGPGKLGRSRLGVRNCCCGKFFAVNSAPENCCRRKLGLIIFLRKIGYRKCFWRQIGPRHIGSLENVGTANCWQNISHNCWQNMSHNCWQNISTLPQLASLFNWIYKKSNYFGMMPSLETPLVNLINSEWLQY